MQILLNKIYNLFQHFLRILCSIKKQHIAIDISSNNIRILELKKYKKYYRLEKFICESISIASIKNDQDKQNHNEKEIILFLKNIIEKNGLKLRNAAISIAYSGVMAKTITIPHKLKEYEIENFLALNIEQHINLSADKISFDYRIQPTTASNSNQTTIELIAAHKQNIDKYTSLLNSCGLKAKLIDIDAYALSRANSLLSLNLDQTHAIINLEKEKVLIVICRKNGFIYAQEYFIENHIFCNTESLTKQIFNNLQLCLTAINQHINTIVLCGTFANINGFMESLNTISNIKTIQSNPFFSMKFAKHLDKARIAKIAPAMTLCCELALQNKHSFNLLPWRQNLHNKKQKKCKTLVGCGILFGSLLAVFWHYMLQQQIKEITIKQDKILQQITYLRQQEKKLKVISNKLVQIKNKLENIKTLKNQQIRYVELLTRISYITPPAIYILNLQKNLDDSISLTGKTDSINSIGEFFHNIGNENLFTQPQIQEIKNTSDQEHIFTITTNLKHSG